MAWEDVVTNIGRRLTGDVCPNVSAHGSPEVDVPTADIPLKLLLAPNALKS